MYFVFLIIYGMMYTYLVGWNIWYVQDHLRALMHKVSADSSPNNLRLSTREVFLQICSWAQGARVWKMFFYIKKWCQPNVVGQWVQINFMHECIRVVLCIGYVEFVEIFVVYLKVCTIKRVLLNDATEQTFFFQQQIIGLYISRCYDTIQLNLDDTHSSRHFLHSTSQQQQRNSVCILYLI